MYIYIYIIIQCVKTRAIPCPKQPPTWGNATVSVAKVVLPPLVPAAAFATEHSMNTNRMKVPLPNLFLL